MREGEAEEEEEDREKQRKATEARRIVARVRERGREGETKGWGGGGGRGREGEERENRDKRGKEEGRQGKKGGGGGEKKGGGERERRRRNVCYGANNPPFPLYQVPAGSEYVVMECIVMEGEDDHTLDPGEVVELVRDSPADAPLLRVRTKDNIIALEGKVASSYLRRRNSIKGGSMESKSHPVGGATAGALTV
jgi:hypothetical protein